MSNNERKARIDAQAYANLIGEAVYLVRRGTAYKATVILTAGWAVVEFIGPSK